MGSTKTTRENYIACVLCWLKTPEKTQVESRRIEERLLTHGERDEGSRKVLKYF